MGKELVVFSNETGLVMMGSVDSGYTLKELLIAAGRYEVESKEVFLDCVDFQTWTQLEDELSYEYYKGSWIRIRIEAANGKDQEVELARSILNVTDFKQSKNMKFVLAWTDHDKEPTDRMYTKAAIEDMQSVMKYTKFDSEFEITIEADIVLASNTIGFRKMFPTIKTLMLTSIMTYEKAVELIG